MARISVTLFETMRNSEGPTGGLRRPRAQIVVPALARGLYVFALANARSVVPYKRVEILRAKVMSRLRSFRMAHHLLAFERMQLETAAVVVEHPGR